MAQLPAGTVTFAFTDIEGSTALLKTLGDAYGATLGEHRRIVRQAFGADGVEIDTQGDAFFFAFARARDAVAASVDVQRTHASFDWPQGAAVHVRIGLHTGEPHVGEEGYLGLDVVRAARICAAAEGGQVLLSEATRGLLRSALPDGVSVFPRGERHLKGIEEPERVFELAIDGVEREPAKAEPEPPEPPESPTRPAPEGFEGRVEDLGKRLASAIEDQVASKLERALARVGSPPAGSAPDDADIERLATRSASLEETIEARIAAALRAKDIAPDRSEP